MDIPLHVDPRAEAPRHRQLYDALRAAILSGRLRPGDRLPSTRLLAQQLTLARATVADAYDQLQAEGYLQGKHGSGTYVAANLPEEGLNPAPATSRAADGPPFRLSPWGERLASPDYRRLLRPAEPATFTYDLRPHGIARDRFPWAAWRNAVETALGEREQLLSYPPSAGHPRLRAAVARHVAKYRAVRCQPDQVVVVNGSLQGLNLLAHLLLRSDDRVAVEDPGYPTARLAFEAWGLDIESVPVDGEGMMVDRLTGRERLIHVTPSHQDPTGATLSLGRRLALLERAEAGRALVIEDDYDSEFRYEGHPVESLQGLDRSGLVVYAGTFSKSVLSGLRIGYMILPAPLVEPFVTAKSLWDSGAPMLEQAALAEFLESGEFERHIRRMRRVYRSRRDALVAALIEQLGATVHVGERHGGLNVLLTLDLPWDEDEIVRRAAAVGVGLRGGSAYFREPPRRPTLLVGFGALPEGAIDEGVRRLAAALR